MSRMPERISSGSALQPSINFFRSGSSCATGICHPAAFAPHSAPLVLKTSLFPEDSCTCSNPSSPIVSLCRVLQICPPPCLRANRKVAALRSARNTLPTAAGGTIRTPTLVLGRSLSTRPTATEMGSSTSRNAVKVYCSTTMPTMFPTVVSKVSRAC